MREAFVRLYEKGLIYRGPRMINWSPGLRTAVCDLEVEYSQEPGTLYYFNYMLADGSGRISCRWPPPARKPSWAIPPWPCTRRTRATSNSSASMVRVPMLGREIPVIADEYVDREFGTGALKITPAHDPNDYAIGPTHNLPMINILTNDAAINENGGPYAGQDRFDCRKQIWADMRAAGLVIKEEPYMLNVPRSQRGGEIVEPMISTQWFVKIQPLADAALAAVRDGRIQIVPERFTKVYYNWLENIQDWCISRQLWWGHRIPVWYCADCGEMTASRAGCHPHAPTAAAATSSRTRMCWIPGSPPALWPFSTLGWPDETPDLAYFYPTSVLETGYDILFFWVARMIMFGLEFTGQRPSTPSICTA